MNQPKISMSKVGNYLREISVVVIGVAITLSLTFWISNSNERKNLSLYLNALKLELEGNAENFDWYAKWLQKSVRYSKYIWSHDEKSLNKDTINYYRHSEDGFGWGSIQSLTVYEKNAFEMFKTSGAMRQANDKELLMAIWRVYSKMENVQLFLDICYQMKRDEVMKEIQFQAIGKTSDVPIQSFFSIGIPNEMQIECKKASKMIKEVIIKLDESKMIK